MVVLMLLMLLMLLLLLLVVGLLVLLHAAGVRLPAGRGWPRAAGACTAAVLLLLLVLLLGTSTLPGWPLQLGQQR